MKKTVHPRGIALKPLLLLLLLVLAFSQAGPARAQDDLDVLGLDQAVKPTPAPTRVDVGVSQDQTTLWWMLKSGGWCMWPLAACSLAVIALCVYNIMRLKATRFFPLELTAALKENMGQCRPGNAMKVAEKSESYLGRLVAFSYKAIDPRDVETLGRDRVKEAMDEFGVRENATHMLWIGYFSILAQVSPLLGLLGTVSGMIKAFGTMGREGMGDPSRLASNISEALITTAIGLIIAIPAILCYFIFRNQLAKLVNRCRDLAEGMLNDLIMAASAPEEAREEPRSE